MGERFASSFITAPSFIPCQSRRRVSSCQSMTPTEKRSERRSFSSPMKRPGEV